MPAVNNGLSLNFVFICLLGTCNTFPYENDVLDQSHSD
jgi:hypothetical protein